MTDAARRFGPAIEAMHVFLKWGAPTVEGFPRSHKFTLGDRSNSRASIADFR